MPCSDNLVEPGRKGRKHDDSGCEHGQVVLVGRDARFY